MWRRGKFIPVRRLADAHLLATIKAAHQPGRSIYGPKKFQAAAQTQLHPVHEQKKVPRHDEFKASVPVAENLLNRQFTPTAPNRVRVGGRHHLYSNEWGWLFLAASKDLYMCEIVGWAVDKQMTKPLVVDALYTRPIGAKNQRRD